MRAVCVGCKIVSVTSFLRGDHQGLGGLPPALPRLRRDAEHVDGLRLEAGHRVLASAGVQNVHRGRVAVGGVEVVRDLVGWKRRWCHTEPISKIKSGALEKRVRGI